MMERDFRNMTLYNLLPICNFILLQEEAQRQVQNNIVAIGPVL